MAKDSSISWTHHTFNPWRGCTKVSPGCKFCYADVLSKRNPTSLGVWGPKGSRPIAAEAYWRLPMRWNAEAAKAGERHRVFCASLADVFEGPETMPENATEDVIEARERLLRLVKETPNLDWLLLTKRPENVVDQLEEIESRNGPCELSDWIFDWTRGGKPPANVWIGASVEDQKTADERIPHLLKIPAAVRFLSCEPLLGPVDLDAWIGQDQFPTHRLVSCEEWQEVGEEEACKGCPAGGPDCPGSWDRGIHWVIAGGESGPNARPMPPDWARSLRDQCAAAGVPFHFKQVGEWDALEHYDQHEWESAFGRRIVDGNGFPDFDDPRTIGWDRDIEAGVVFRKVGVKNSGRLLDGVLHDAFPEVAHAR